MKPEVGFISIILKYVTKYTLEHPALYHSQFLKSTDYTSSRCLQITIYATYIDQWNRKVD
jgi:hypothetical protein